MKRTVLAVPLVLVAVAGSFLLGGTRQPEPATAAPTAASADEGVVVDGVGTVVGIPDVLHLTLGVSGSGPDVTRTLATVDAQVARVRAELRKAGADGNSIQTQNVSVYPMQTKKGRVFQVSEQLTAVLPVKTAGAAISQALLVGGKSVSLDNVSFALEKDEALLNRARTEAFADAKQKAERYARLSGRSLGKVQLVSESLRSPATPYPAGSPSFASLREAKDVRLYAGTSEVSVSVSIRWSLG